MTVAAAGSPPSFLARADGTRAAFHKREGRD